jgi:hypothetical protein
MTIIRLHDNRLVIHNSMRLLRKDLDWLTSLGQPAYIIAPNSFHCSDAGWMARLFPSAELFVPCSKLDTFANEGFSPKDVNEKFPVEISNELKCIPMLGTRMHEAAFVHLPSKTLILCDLAFNMGNVFSGFEGLMMKWNRVGGQFGPSRLTKLLFAKNRKTLLESYQRLLADEFDRVIVNHGEVLESGGKEKLRAGVERIFGSASPSIG